MKITYGTVKNQQFVRAFNTLANHPQYKDWKTTRRIYEIHKEIRTIAKDIAELEIKMLKGYAELDDAGNIKPISDTQPGTYKILDDKVEEFQKVRKEFDETEVELNVKPVQMEKLEGVPLSPRDLEALQPILTNLDVV